jgi:hypothetical protein
MISYKTFEHFLGRLTERFNETITYEDYINKFVLKRDIPEKYVGKYVRYESNNRIYVYYITKKLEIPITVYKITRFNKGKILKELQYD